MGKQTGFMEIKRVSEPSLPVTERLSRRVLCLPNGTAVSPEDITKVTSLIRGIAKLGGKVRAALHEAKA